MIAHGAKKLSTFAFLKKHWLSETAAYPIFVVVGVACGGAGWYVARLAKGHDVVWARHSNPEPWNNVEQGTQTKMMTITPNHFDKVYKRDRW